MGLLASSNSKNIVGKTAKYDTRTLAAKRRKQAASKATDVMLEMLKTAIRAGHQVKYVLFGTWFANPKEIIRIHEECGLDTIAMIKKISKIRYSYDGLLKSIVQIYNACKTSCFNF